jgi:hypothetical protein
MRGTTSLLSLVPASSTYFGFCLALPFVFHVMILTISFYWMFLDSFATSPINLNLGFLNWQGITDSKPRGPIITFGPLETGIRSYLLCYFLLCAQLC